MDDEDELRELNLSSRPRREERRRQREREKLERELVRCEGRVSELYRSYRRVLELVRYEGRMW